MRRVERGPAPFFTRDEDFAERRADYEFFRADGGTRTQQTFLDLGEAFGPFGQEVSMYALDLFRGKCAYTESPLSEHSSFYLHRPHADALDDRRGVSSDHYWWMAFWFQNWYVATEDVASLKRNTFAVTGRRASVPLIDRRWRDEWRPLRIRRDVGVVLDPCVDFPQMHLRFRRDGLVEPWARYEVPWMTREQVFRGDRTIELLALNSPALIQARRSMMSEVENPGDAAVFDQALPHLGAVRQGLAATLLEQKHMWDEDAIRQLAPELVPMLIFKPDAQLKPIAETVLDALPASHRPLRTPLARAFDLPDFNDRRYEGLMEAEAQAPHRADIYAPPIRRAISRNAALSRVRINNFQAIRDFDYEFPPSVDKQSELMVDSHFSPGGSAGPAGRPWWVLLGENGAGKSSVLKAIGLALAGTSLSKLSKAASLRWSDLARRHTRSGRIILDFSEGSTISLRFDSEGAKFDDDSSEFDGFVRGFGASRLREQSDEQDDAHVRLGNLFDPMQPVVHSEKWLLEIGDEDFNTAGVTIARLLDRAEDVKADGGLQEHFLGRERDEVTVAGEPIRTLSDGYRSVIALACDLMAGAGSGLSDMRNASGIVLLDELGAHLHPRWKMRITSTLREEFPSMQFLVTTHDPLCLRGLEEREVIGARRSVVIDQEWHAEFDRIEQSPSKLRVDQLLTSDFFGLSTTIDPGIDELFQEYYSLLRLREPTLEQQVSRDALRGRLSRHGVLGYTARDQLVYEAIDQFLATRDTLSSDERRTERARTLKSVAQIWRGVAARYEDRGQL